MRFEYVKVSPEVLNATLAFNSCLSSLSIERSLQELIKIRASQINGCAFCLDMHIPDAIKLGESQRRINVIAAWHDSNMFTPREQAALALTEAVTTISVNGVSDELYERVRKQFSEREYVELIMTINVINCWNRLSVSTGTEPLAIAGS